MTELSEEETLEELHKALGLQRELIAEQSRLLVEFAKESNRNREGWEAALKTLKEQARARQEAWKLAMRFVHNQLLELRAENERRHIEIDRKLKAMAEAVEKASGF